MIVRYSTVKIVTNVIQKIRERVHDMNIVHILKHEIYIYLVHLANALSCYYSKLNKY